MGCRAVLLSWVCLLVAPAAGGCSDLNKPAEIVPQGNFSLEQAREFQEFELYALGESHGEHELTAVVRQFDGRPEAPPVRVNFVDFLYGTCTPAPGSERRCSPPLSVQVWTTCKRNPTVDAPGQDAPMEIRGVPAYFYDGGSRLELSTGTSTVVIFAGGREKALAAAASLRGVNNSVAPGQPLPGPAYTPTTERGVVTVECA
jgi:hypothetical protein